MGKDIDKILIVRLSSLGDIVNLTVIFSKLRQQYPKSEITFIIKKQFKDIVEVNPFGIKVITYDTKTGLAGWIQLCRKMQSEKFALFLDMHNNIRSKILGFYLRNSWKLQYHKPLIKRFILFNFHINLFSKNYNLVDEYLKVLKPLGIGNYHVKTEIFLANATVMKAKEILTQKGVKRKFAVMAPISAWESKLYPIEKFIKIADYLILEKEMDIVWLGGKGDKYLDKHQLKKEHSFTVIGDSSLMESIAILQESEIVIGNDTGLLYAAQAVGTPALIIFGPSSRETSAGYIQNNSRVLEKKLWCRPCSKGNRKCFRKEQYCMQHSIAEIEQNINQILSGVNK